MSGTLWGGRPTTVCVCCGLSVGLLCTEPLNRRVQHDDQPTGIRPDGLERPHPDRFDASRADYALCLRAHDDAQVRGDMGYFDPTTGLFVMTARHLAARPCCSRGCRHCPWIGASE